MKSDSFFLLHFCLKIPGGKHKIDVPSLSAALQLVSSNSRAQSFPWSSKLTWSMNVLQYQHHVSSFCAEPHWCCEPAAIWAGKNSLWCTFLRWSCYCWVSMRLRNAHLIFTVWNLMYCFLTNSKEAPVWGNKNEFFWLQFLCGWVSWFNPRRQLSTTQPLAHSSPRWDGGENQKGKSEKTCGLR